MNNARRLLPLQLVVGGVVLTLGLASGMVWALGGLESRYTHLSAEILAEARLSGSILHLDEVLTASARLAAATGDPAWSVRYDQHEPELEDTIQQALLAASDGFSVLNARELTSANDDLVLLELAAFEQVQLGDLQAAGAVLDSEAYQLHKQRYRSSLGALRSSLQMRTETTLEQLQHDLRGWILLGAAGLVALGAIWQVLLGLIRRSLEQRDASERALDQARADAEQATRSKAAFLANMSHEIRTPMNGVLGMAHILKDTELDAEQLETVEIIERSGQSLLAIINDILDVSKMEAGELQLESIPFSLQRCVTDVCSMLLFRAQAQSIHLRHHLDPNLPAELIGDPIRLRQVLTNLLSNALKFTQDGGVDVTVVGMPDSHGMDVLIEVRDSGIGIAPEALSRLFQPYAQAEASTSRNYGGTGLGLSICQQLVGLMGGTIDVTSVPGEGSVFRVIVPLELLGAEGPAHDADASETSAPTSTAGAVSG